MTIIIKPSSMGDAHRPIQRFGETSAQGTSALPSREAQLEFRIAELEAELGRLEESRPKDLADAREAGAKEALAKRSKAEALALKQLKRALVEAQARWSDQLRAFDANSIGIARATLEQVFADPAGMLARVTSAIKYQLRRFDDASVVRLRVSARDFPADDMLASLKEELGRQIELASDRKLMSGDCFIDLKLGHVEVGVGSQWKRISDLLDRLEREALDA